MKTRRGIYYQWDGEAGAPVLLFSNSLGTNLSLWDEQVEALRGDFHILRYDIRGHGQSFYWEEALHLEDLGFDVIQMLDELQVDRAHFCGISLGGFIGLWLGRHHGKRFRSLTLANTSPRIASVESWQQRIDLIKKEGLAPVAASSAARWFTPEFVQKQPDIVKSFRQNLTTTSPQSYIACCQILRDNDLWSLLPEIKCPSLVLAGESDPVTTPLEARDMAAQIPGAELYILKASHLSNVESPEFTSTLLRFLKKH